jgi:hypothetical protein
MSAADVRAMIAAALPVAPLEATNEPPLPLMRELPPADPYPTAALAGLAEAARAIHDVVRLPIAICGQSVLAAAALAVQAHADVVLPTGHARPLSLYCVSVAVSGERKNGCDTEALKPVRDREADLRVTYDGELLAHRNATEAWEAERQAIRADKKRLNKVAALDALGPAPKPPLVPMLTAEEPTIEGLHKLLAIGWPSLGIFSTEGGQFVGGHGMRDENKLRTAAALSRLWDDGEVRRVRSGDGAIVLVGRRVSTHLMVQPGVAATLLSDPLLQDQGLLSRLLITAPDSTMGTRLWRELQAATRPALARYGARMRDLLAAPLPLAAGKPNELRPRPLPLDPEARALWIAFADDTERRLADEYRPITGLANKLPEHAARIAGVLTLADDLAASHVRADALAAGVDLANHYAGEALRLHMAGGITPALAEARALLSWCQRQPGGLVSLPDIVTRGPNNIREVARARPLIAVLEQHRWLIEVQGGCEVAGRHRREVWRVRQGDAT